MSANAVVRRWLKVADPAAITARETLQRALELGRTLEGIRRSEVFAFTWDVPVADPIGALAALARDTNLLRNPNKHHVEIAGGDEALHPEGNVWVLVFETGDGEEVGEVIARRRLVDPAPARVRRATLWELTAAGDPAALAEAAAVTRERRRGLLANPNYQEVRILVRVPTARDVVDAMTAVPAGDRGA